MQTYRAYIVEEEKTFKNFQEFNAEDDGDALRKAEALVNGNPVELWEGRRLIGTLKPVRRRAQKLAHI
jgi:hypothetical protein